MEHEALGAAALGEVAAAVWRAADGVERAEDLIRRAAQQEFVGAQGGIGLRRIGGHGGGHAGVLPAGVA